MAQNHKLKTQNINPKHKPHFVQLNPACAKFEACPSIIGSCSFKTGFNSLPHRRLRVPLARDVEEYPVVAEDGVRDSVAVVVDRAEPAAAADELGVVLRVAELGALGGLRRGQPPRLAQDLLRG